MAISSRVLPDGCQFLSRSPPPFVSMLSSDTLITRTDAVLVSSLCENQMLRWRPDIRHRRQRQRRCRARPSTPRACAAESVINHCSVSTYERSCSDFCL